MSENETDEPDWWLVQSSWLCRLGAYAALQFTCERKPQPIFVFGTEGDLLKGLLSDLCFEWGWKKLSQATESHSGVRCQLYQSISAFRDLPSTQRYYYFFKSAALWVWQMISHHSCFCLFLFPPGKWQMSSHVSWTHALVKVPVAFMYLAKLDFEPVLVTKQQVIHKVILDAGVIFALLC